MRNAVTVFIGSSFHEMQYRRCIGNRIRELSYKWEKLGVRIYLKRWEDFKATYGGKSKQQEYIDELVLPSNICIFFFGRRIGKYTERELDACIKANHQEVYCYRVAFNKRYQMNAGVQKKLRKKGTAPIDCMNKDAFANDVTTKIEQYISKHNLANGKPIDDMEEKWLYTTIPDDMAYKRDEFGTTIRALDDICEQFLNIRCKLHPLYHEELLENSDHYVPYCKIRTSDADISEIKKALALVDAGQRLKITFFVTPGYKIHEDNEKVKELLDGRELFTCSVNGPETIKWELFTWMMREKKMVLGQQIPGMSIKEDQLLVDGRSVVSLKTLDPSGNMQQLLLARNEADRQIALIKNDNPQLLKRLQNKKTEAEAKLLFGVIACINNWINGEYCRRVREDIGNNDLDAAKAVSRIGTARLEALETERRHTISEMRTSIKNINQSISEKTIRLGKDRVAEEIKELVETKETILRSLVKHEGAAPQELLDTQMYLVRLFDTYLYPGQKSKEEDMVYKRIIDDADNFAVSNPHVEVIRMNYGNSFSRRENYREALKHYQKAVENLERMDDDSWMTLRIKSTVYARLYHTYREKGDVDGMRVILQKMKQHVDHCMSLGKQYLTDKAMYMCALLTSRKTVLDGDDGVVREAIQVYDSVKNELHLPVTDQWYHDIYCFLPTQIAGYLIDHQHDYEGDGRLRVLDIAEGHLLDAEKNAMKVLQTDRNCGLHYLAEINHQLGFLYYNKGLQFYDRAGECYCKSIAYKKAQMVLDGAFEHETRYAQTLVNLGAVMAGVLELKSKGMKIAPLPGSAIDIASEAVEIYRRHLNSDSIMSEQHFFEALQLLGTVFYYKGIIEKNDELIEKSKPLLRECVAWNEAHPSNTYAQNFEDNAVSILKEIEGMDSMA